MESAFEPLSSGLDRVGPKDVINPFEIRFDPGEEYGSVDCSISDLLAEDEKLRDATSYF